jgi:acyl carrier protein
MADAVEFRVRTVIAAELKLTPAETRPETRLTIAELGWRRLYAIADRIERGFGIRFDLGAADLWLSVADVVAATERAIARDAALAAAAAAARRGRAA